MATADEILHWFRHYSTDADEVARFSRATTLEVAQAFGMSTDSAYRLLARLARQGVLRRAGRVSMRGRFRGLQSEPGWQLWEYHWRS